MLSSHPPQRAVTSSTSFTSFSSSSCCCSHFPLGKTGPLLPADVISERFFNRRDKFPYEIYKPWKQLQSRSEREALNYVKTRVPLLTEGSVSVATRKGRKKQMKLSWNDVFFLLERHRGGHSAPPPAPLHPAVFIPPGETHSESDLGTFLRPFNNLPTANAHLVHREGALPEGTLTVLSRYNVPSAQKFIFSNSLCVS